MKYEDETKESQQGQQDHVHQMELFDPEAEYDLWLNPYKGTLAKPRRGKPNVWTIFGQLAMQHNVNPPAHMGGGRCCQDKVDVVCECYVCKPPKVVKMDTVDELFNGL